MRQTDKASVMVVDDQPANLRLLEDMLSHHGYAIRSFPRGRLALASAAQSPPDVILLDINMPEMNGFEVCQHLKSDQKLARIPIIFLSALHETEDKIKATRAAKRLRQRQAEEDAADVAEARRRLRDPNRKTISLARLKVELGL